MEAACSMRTTLEIWTRALPSGRFCSAAAGDIFRPVRESWQIRCRKRNTKSPSTRRGPWSGRLKKQEGSDWSAEMRRWARGPSHFATRVPGDAPSNGPGGENREPGANGGGRHGHQVPELTDAVPPADIFSLYGIPSLFQIASTRALVAASISIIGGQGRVNPSAAHLRVAS